MRKNLNVGWGLSPIFPILIKIALIGCIKFNACAGSSPKGSLDEINENDYNFYNMKGHPDIVRCPLRRPYSLISLNTESVSLLCSGDRFGSGVLLTSDILGVGLICSNFVLRTEHNFYLIDSSGECTKCYDKHELINRLSALGCNAIPRLYYAKAILMNFHQTGSCLPLYDNSTLAWENADQAMIRSILTKGFLGEYKQNAPSASDNSGKDEKKQMETAERLGIVIDCETYIKTEKPDVRSKSGKKSIVFRLLHLLLGCEGYGKVMGTDPS